MKYVQINSVSYGSTGSVMFQNQEKRRALGDECWSMWGRGRAASNDHEFKFGSKAGFYWDVVRTRLDDRAGFHQKRATRLLLERLDAIDPDVVHLHNVHGYYVNIGMLFDWLAARKQQTLWTLHDCWAFTGHCAHFTYIGCDKWHTCGCTGTCPQKGAYPKAVLKSAAARNFADKKRLFTQLPADKLTILVPSQWLAGIVRQSFLGEYPVRVQPNEIDRTVFKPTPSEVRNLYGIGQRFMVLGVANPWTQRKGLDDFLRLAQALDDDYRIVLVGLDAKQASSLPANMTGLPRTDSAEELATWYTAADVFLNPTKEDSYPTVNLEAEACGTPVITYDVGGCAETVKGPHSVVVPGYAEARDAIHSMARGCHG